MELPPLTSPVDDQSLPPFEWSDLFDFTIDEPLFSPFDSTNLPPPVPPPEPEHEPESSSDRVRKRDPRLVCENFLAGRIPCACPEMDAKMEEEEEEEEGEKEGAARGKKRARTRRAGVARCQVPGCEADISELKGYHKRHRVCLLCAHAASVVIDGDTKRYCQQCGKFHVLSDFDEGKRSCRRKLERHNNRRRRKQVDARGTEEKEPQVDLQTEDVSSDSEPGKENTWSSQDAEREDSKDGTLSNLCSLDSRNVETDSAVTFTQVDKAIDNTKCDDSPPSYDNKSPYSSVCPTGRISFKLYDWNPAEFPRRLRHQIFQWLASMPVELEGYIRPGCTILTAFVSMPQSMWLKLFDDPISYVQSSVAPGGMLSGKGTALVYLNNMSFRVMKDGSSVLKVNVALRTPKLHYVYPPCFEAGKPMDLIACGSNLLQPKFRSLISFAGKYMPHDYCVAFPGGKDIDEYPIHSDRQFCRIYVPCTEPSFFGPAFIEIENENGLSNFIPILIGDEHVCSEINMIHQKYDCSRCKKNSNSRHGCSSNCESSCSSNTSFSEFMLDVAWLLKWPHPEKLQEVITSVQIQRFNHLLNFLMSNKSISILERVLQSVQIVFDEAESGGFVYSVSDSDWRSFMEHIGHARVFLQQGIHKGELHLSHPRSSVLNDDNLQQSSSDIDTISIDDTHNQVINVGTDKNSAPTNSPDVKRKWETVPFLNEEIAMNMDNREWSRKSCNLMATKKYVHPRPFLYMIVAIAVCAGVCAVVYHPNRVGRLAVTIRRCLFNIP